MVRGLVISLAGACAWFRGLVILRSVGMCVIRDADGRLLLFPAEKPNSDRYNPWPKYFFTGKCRQLVNPARPMATVAVPSQTVVVLAAAKNPFLTEISDEHYVM